MKNKIIAVLILTASAAGVCLANNTAGNAPNPPVAGNGMNDVDRNSSYNSYTNSTNSYAPASNAAY